MRDSESPGRKVRNRSRRRVVLSVEQALSMPYATLRFVHLGWRVIRVEQTPVAGRTSRGDPNRSIGRPVAGEDRHSYYVAPNAGKEAIALNLKEEEGRAILRRLIRDLPVDVFCTNTMPAHHEKLGIDYETIRAERDDIVAAYISAMGTAHPDVPGYDPVTQALCGYMDLTGEREGPPMQCGPPIIDLKAGDEVFAQVALALLDREGGGGGRMIDVSLAQVAVSWLHTFLPMLDMGSPPEEIRRSGNQHRQFIPVNAYATSDGYIYAAIGSDAQWKRFVEHPLFASLDEEGYRSNEGRRKGKEKLHASIGEITKRHSSEEVSRALKSAGIPHSPITPIEKVWDLPFVQAAALETISPEGRRVRLPPPAVSTAHLEKVGGRLPFSPAYGEQTDTVLGEVGLSDKEIADLRGRGVVA